MKRLSLLLAFAFFCLSPTLADQGMTSELHRQNVGKIVFSNSEIKFRNEDPAQLRTEIKLSEPLYARVYLPKAMLNHPFYIQGQEIPMARLEAHQTIKMFIDGKKQAYRFGEFAAHEELGEKAATEWTTWQMNLNPTDRSLGRRYVMEAWT